MIVTNGVEFTPNIGGGCDASRGKAPKQTAENCDPVFNNEGGERSVTRPIADAIVTQPGPKTSSPRTARKGRPPRSMSCRISG